MYHLESLAAAHTSMTDFFVHTILATHRKLSDAELAGFSRLMEIVISPTQEEVADQLAELAYSEDEWEEFQTQYSKAVSTTNELDIIQRMVELRKVGCLFFFFGNLSRRSPFASGYSLLEALFIRSCLG